MNLYSSVILIIWTIVTSNGQEQDIAGICMNKLSWTADRLEYVLNGSPSRDMGCWNSCLLHQSNVMKDNKYDEEVFKHAWDRQKKLKQLEYACLVRANELTDPCEVTNYFASCYHEAVIQFEQQTHES